MIKLTNITKSFGDLQILKGITMSVAKGEILAIVGPSGAGKSTLLHIIGTLDTPSDGDVVVDDTNISGLSGDKLACFRNERVGFVFQFHNLLPEFTALENVMLPALIQGRSRSDSQKAALELLSTLALSDRAEHKPSQLSGGEAQRVAVARAMINNPAVILADEPTGNLDSASRDELYSALINLRDSRGVTIILVTHDTAVAHQCDRVIHLVDGELKGA